MSGRIADFRNTDAPPRRPGIRRFKRTASNLLGAVVGLFDNAGTLMVEYEYDAWGKPTK